MKKVFYFALVAFLFAPNLFAQSDEDLFGSSDDDFFEDDGIVAIEDMEDSSAAKDNSLLSQGVLFEDGSIKIAGNFDTSITTITTLWEDNDEKFSDRIKDTILLPTAKVLLSLDARPTQTLRMFTKFGISYPFESNVQVMENMYGSTTANFSSYLKLKELFTDFSIADRAFFRFGLHTVTWGAGYFFSPVSDMINTTSINPEDTDAQVEGCFNLRTQITFPGTQNCLWFYVIPSTNFKSDYTAETYAKETAFAAKTDILLGNWEFGLGGFYKYKSPVKAMLTATGSLKKISFFGEFVYQHGTENQWTNNLDKDSVFYATAGLSYYWKEPLITFAAQYYFDSNDEDIKHIYVTKGHNIAAFVNFGRIFGTTDFTINIFGMANFGKDELSPMLEQMLSSMGINSSYLSSITTSVMFNYSPVKSMTLSCGPYITWKTTDSKPKVDFQIKATLGGGKF